MAKTGVVPLPGQKGIDKALSKLDNVSKDLSEVKQLLTGLKKIVRPPPFPR